MENAFVNLMKKYQKGSKPAISLGPFLPLARIKERGLSFNEIIKDSQAMTEAAMMSFEFGFESTVMPFDLNVEAEILGAKVQYHEGFDGHPVYPTIAHKPFTPDDDDIDIPDALVEEGRMPAILKTIGSLKEQAQDKGSVGVFIPGPFMLAGQVMDMDELYQMLLEKPDKTVRIFERFTAFICKLIDVYVRAGVNFMIVVEEGGSNISPKTFRNQLLPCMQEIFKSRQIPGLVRLFGNSEKIVESMLACDPDGIILDKECSIENTRGRLPDGMPLFGECGAYDMLANATPEEISKIVNRYLDMGFTTVLPPADIYPPAKNENIEAFVKALREYKK